MALIFDNDDEIKGYLTQDVLSELMRLATFYENGTGTAILKNAGLSKYVDDYELELTPFYFNGTWKNANPHYNPKEVFVFFYEQMKNDKQHLYLFLKSITEKIRKSYTIDLTNIQLHLKSIGFVLIEPSETNYYSIEVIDIPIVINDNDTSYFERKVNALGEGIMNFYDEAISDFRNSSFVSCIGCCRNFLEKIITLKTGISNCAKAIFEYSNEKFVDGAQKVEDINQAISYWAAKRNKVSKFMRMYTLYNILCEYGSHPSAIPSMNDALWILKETQSTVLWILDR